MRFSRRSYEGTARLARRCHRVTTVRGTRFLDTTRVLSTGYVNSSKVRFARRNREELTRRVLLLVGGIAGWLRMGEVFRVVYMALDVLFVSLLSCDFYGVVLSRPSGGSANRPVRGLFRCEQTRCCYRGLPGGKGEIIHS